MSAYFALVRNTFAAQYRGTCGHCFDAIEVGDSVHYNESDELVHHRHARPERTFLICERCHLAKPCDCE